MTTAESIYILGLVILPLGLMVLAYVFKKPAMAFGATAGWLLWAISNYQLSAVLWDLNYGAFWFGMALVLISALEGMALRTKHEEELEGEQSDLEKSIARAEAQREKMDRMSEALGGKESITSSRRKKRGSGDGGTRLG